MRVSRWSPGIRARIIAIVGVAAAGMAAAGIGAQTAIQHIERAALELQVQGHLREQVVDIMQAMDSAQVHLGNFERRLELNGLADAEKMIGEAGRRIESIRALPAAAFDAARLAKLDDAYRKIKDSASLILPPAQRVGPDSLPELSVALEAASKNMTELVALLYQRNDSIAELRAALAIEAALRIEASLRSNPDRIRVLDMEAALDDARAAAASTAKAKAVETATQTYGDVFGKWLDAASGTFGATAIARNVMLILVPIVRDIESASIAATDRLAADRTVAAARLRWLLWGGLAGVTTLALGLALLVGRSITRPMEAISGAMTRLSRGETDLTVPHGDRQNEIGAMARALAVFQQAIREREQLSGGQLAEAARRDARGQRLASAVDVFNRSIGEAEMQVGAASDDLSALAVKLIAVSEQLERQMHQAVEASDSTAARAGSVAAAAEQLAQSISEIMLQITSASAGVREAAAASAAASERMASLRDATGDIGAVVQLIRDVAERTNLLALNATIEAARAGVAGRGFAVVAEEIKALAAQTSKATQDIGRIIASVQTSASEGVDSVKGLSDQLSAVSASASTVAAAVGQQEASVGEIARVVADLSANAREATAAASAALTVSEDSVRMADSVRSLSTSLADARRSFTDETQRFIAAVHAA